MSAFAVAAFHDARLPAGAEQLEAAVWIRADGIDPTEVSLRIWTPTGASVLALREIAPAAVDLIAVVTHVDDYTLEVGAGCWTDGAREYALVLSLPARAAGEEMLAARVAVVAGEAVVGQARIAVTWTAAAGPAADAPRPPADAAGPAAAAARPAAAAAAPDGTAPDTVAVATSDLPTGASPEPRHGATNPSGGHPCPGCGTQAGDGDRYCEACGRELS